MSKLKFSSLLIFISLIAYVRADEPSNIDQTAFAETESISLYKPGQRTSHPKLDNDQKTSSDKKEASKTTSDQPASPNKSSEQTPAELPEATYDQGHGLPEIQTLRTYNFPARIEVKEAWDLALEADYIYWQQKEKGIDYGLIVPSYVPTNSYKIAKMNFEYQSGFKVALGTNFDHDNWTALIEYVRLHGKTKAKADAPLNGSINPYFIHNANIGNSASSLKTHWGLSYDILNLEFARACYIGTKLTFYPYIGMTGGWIDQRVLSIGTFLTNTFTIFGKTYSYSWLIGPRAGLNTNWFLGYGFDIKADLAASLPYQKIKTGFKQQSQYYSYSLAYRIRENIAQITPILEGALGFSWGSYFNAHKWNFTFKALYEFLYYFEQNHMRKLADLQLRNVKTKPGDLMLHGLTAAIELDF